MGDEHPDDGRADDKAHPIVPADERERHGGGDGEKRVDGEKARNVFHLLKRSILPPPYNARLGELRHGLVKSVLVIVNQIFPKAARDRLHRALGDDLFQIAVESHHPGENVRRVIVGADRLDESLAAVLPYSVDGRGGAGGDGIGGPGESNYAAFFLGRRSLLSFGGG